MPTERRVVLVYAVVGVVWIVASTLLVAGDDTGTTVAEMAKGLGFVAASALLVWLLLRRYVRRLAANDRRYRTLVEGAGEAVYRYRLRPQPGFDYISDSVVGLSGYTPEQYYTDPRLARATIHPDDRSVLGDAEQGALPDGPARVRWVRPDGTLVVTEHRVVAIRDRAGVLTAIDGRVRDVTAEVADLTTSALLADVRAWALSGREREELAERSCARLVAELGVVAAWCGATHVDGTLHTLGHDGPIPPPAPADDLRWDHGPLAEGPVGQAVSTGATQVAHVPEGLPPGWVEVAADHELHALVAVPLRARAGVCGVLVLTAGRGNPFHGALLGRLERVAAALASSFELADEARERRAALAALEATANGVVIADAAGRVEWTNPAFERLTGFDRAELVGQDLRTTDPGDRPPQLLDDMWHALRAGRPWRHEMVRRRKDGTLVSVREDLVPLIGDDGTLQRVIGVLEDLTPLRTAEDRLSMLARHDEATGLPNSTLVEERLADAIAWARRRGGHVGVVRVRLRTLTQLTARFGVAAGGEVLQRVVHDLRTVVPPGAVLGRTANDELTVVLDRMQDPDELVALGRQLAATLDRDVEMDGASVHLAADLGAAVFPQDALDEHGLVARADTAREAAAKDHSPMVRFWSDDLQRRMGTEMDLDVALRHALDHGELELHWQPQVLARTGRSVVVEALLRWRRGSELVTPAAFLPFAEATGLIRPLGAWALRDAIRQGAAWASAWRGRIAVNISARQVGPELVADVQQALADHALPADRLELEIVESALLADAIGASGILGELRRLGVHIAIDDYGTGWSSLSYLAGLPADVLKIDRSFVSGVGHDVRAGAVVRSTIGLGHALGLEVVAEGVENVAQAAFLRRAGCDRLQGFAVCRPLPAGDLPGVLPPWAWTPAPAPA